MNNYKNKTIRFSFSLLHLWVVCFSFILESCKLFSMPEKESASHHLTNHPPTKQKILIILNGLWQSRQEFDLSVQRLQEAFQAQNLAVTLDILEEIKTSEKDIAQQAADAFHLLKEKYSAHGCEIILLGHSQGGLRAAKMLEINQEAGNPLDIKGLITTGTPWEGAPVAAITKQTVKTYLSKLPGRLLLSGVRYFYPASAQFTNDYYLDQMFDGFPTDQPGVRDMVPGSVFLSIISASLSNNSLPILAVGGSNGDLRSLLLRSNLHTQYNISASYINSLPINSAYRYIFAGGFLKDHDMVVPLHSQLATNIRKNNSFTTYKVSDAIHDFLPGLEIPLNQIIYNHPAVIDQIVVFAKKHFIW